LCLISFTDALEVENLAEVGVGFVGYVDEVCLDESFGGRRADLEGFEERVDAGHALIHAFDETTTIGSVAEEWFEGAILTLQVVRYRAPH
jgi:hypothetical protein